MSNLTKKALISSFFKLLSTRPFKKITISNITDDCGVNRMTFYYHFRDINDLVEKAFEESFNEITKNTQGERDWSATYLSLFEMVFNKKDYVKKLYPEFDFRDLLSFIFPFANKIAHEIVECHTKKSIDKAMHLRLVHSISCCIVGSFFEWLESDMARKPAELVNEQKSFFNNAINGALNQS